MRRATIAASLLLCGCLTPLEAKNLVDEDRTSYIEDARKVAGELDSEVVRGAKKYADDADDAVRKEQEEYHHHSKDERLAMAATNAKQHAMLRDALDRNTLKDDQRWEAFNLDLSKLRGKVEGNDAALHSAEGVVRGMLFQSMGQLNQATALARDNERKIALSEEAKKLQRERDLADLREANAAQQDAHFAKLEAAFWDFVQKMAATAGVIAAILGALVTIIYLWKKKGKTDG